MTTSRGKSPRTNSKETPMTNTDLFQLIEKSDLTTSEVNALIAEQASQAEDAGTTAPASVGA